MKTIRMAFAAAFLSVLFMTPKTYADVNDFAVTEFSADYYLSRDDPQGSLRIVENLSVDFTGQNHGILRAIPKTYEKKSVKLQINKVSSASGAPSQYTTYEDSGNEVLKIGDPNRTITGKQSYTIDYTVQNVITFYDGYDELFWDINGDNSDKQFNKVISRFHIPDGLVVQDKLCFTGVFDSREPSCDIKDADDGILVTTTRILGSYENLSVLMKFQKGHFAAPTLKDWWNDNRGKVLAMAIPPLVIGTWALNHWRKRGKDLKGRGVIIPEYKPPKLTPGEAAIIYDYRLNTKDISATIIDLAIRGYIKIIETKEKKLLKDKLKYEFVLNNADFSALKQHEQDILNGLFTDAHQGETVSLDSLKNNFYKTFQKVQRNLPQVMVKQGYFTSNPSTSGTRLWIATGILFVLAMVIHSWLSFGLALSAAITALLAILMPKRTQMGVDTKEALEGLKLYMSTAEEDRIKMLQSPDAKYAANHHEPKKTVHLFEKLLPFAIFLGVEKDWAKQFEGIYKQAPEWYSGNWSSFNTAYLASSLSDSVSAMGTNFSPPSSSGGSGFSGGGSGGGGGGGGGGGW